MSAQPGSNAIVSENLTRPSGINRNQPSWMRHAEWFNPCKPNQPDWPSQADWLGATGSTHPNRLSATPADAIIRQDPCSELTLTPRRIHEENRGHHPSVQT